MFTLFIYFKVLGEKLPTNVFVCLVFISSKSEHGNKAISISSRMWSFKVAPDGEIGRSNSRGLFWYLFQDTGFDHIFLVSQ